MHSAFAQTSSGVTGELNCYCVCLLVRLFTEVQTTWDYWHPLRPLGNSISGSNGSTFHILSPPNVTSVWPSIILTLRHGMCVMVRTTVALLFWWRTRIPRCMLLFWRCKLATFWGFHTRSPQFFWIHVSHSLAPKCYIYLAVHYSDIEAWDVCYGAYDCLAFILTADSDSKMHVVVLKMQDASLQHFGASTYDVRKTYLFSSPFPMQPQLPYSRLLYKTPSPLEWGCPIWKHPYPYVHEIKYAADMVCEQKFCWVVECFHCSRRNSSRC